MSPSDDESIATPELDEAVTLPARNKSSLAILLTVQGLNAFNDNFVKMLFLAFAGAAAKGTELGDQLQVYLGPIYALGYIFFGPLAGWLSDRYSKQRVILWMQVCEVLVFGLFTVALSAHDAQLTLKLSLACFFVLATQAAFLGPAKMGVLKELVGSRRLGAASGALQMTMFMGILSGAAAGGWWYGHRLAHNHNAWEAAWYPLLVVMALSATQIIGALGIQATPSHPGVRFQRSVLWEHFVHLRLLFSQRPIKLAGLGITYFWFLCNSIATILIGLAHEIEHDPAEAAKGLSLMTAMLGVGVMGGSVMSSLVCKRRIELGLVPLAGMGLTLGLLGAGLWAHMGLLLYASLIFVGIAGGCFMSPLYAFVQDRAKKDERARILAAINLMDGMAAILASLGFVKVLTILHVQPSGQLLVLVPLAFIATLFVTKLLPQSLLKLVLAFIVRTLYRLEGHHQELLPREGGVLLVVNHTSYADAIILGALCDRDVRFVMTDTLYKMPSINWFLKLFGTVPISPKKAKEAIRIVADSLKAGDCVCLFPEGQLTRTGFMNELRKGFELMARVGGDAPVQPVWLDGLWGSIFSFEGGRFFKKAPKALPYRVSAWFGAPMKASEANIGKVQNALLTLGAEAFNKREAQRHAPRLRGLNGSSPPQQALVNGFRVLDTSLLHEHDVICCLLPVDHPMTNTFKVALPALRKLEVLDHLPEKHYAARLIVVGDEAELQRAKLAASGDTPPWTLAVSLTTWEEFQRRPPGEPSVGLPGLFHAETGALLTLSVPHPEMPPGDEDWQHGFKAGSAGRVLPGMTIASENGALILRNVLPGASLEIRLEHVVRDDEGFLSAAPVAEPQASI